MVRTLMLLLLGAIALGVVATPGLAFAGLVIAPFAVLIAAWWIALGPPDRRSEAVVRIRNPRLLGPGGPDDPFAADEHGRVED